MKQKIKMILGSVRQYKKFALITPIFMVFEVILECFLPFVMSGLIDTVTQGVQIQIGQVEPALKSFEDIFKTITYTNVNLNLTLNVTVFGIIITLVIMALLSLICGIFGGLFASKASVGMSTNLREDMYKKIQSFSFSNIDKFSSASLVTRMTTDINNVRMGFQMLIRIVVRAPLMMIFSAIMAFISGGMMAFIFVFLIPILAVGLYFIMKTALRIFMKLFKRYDKLNESIEENVSAIRVVKSFVREDFEKLKFNKASDDLTIDFIKAEKIIALNSPLVNTAIHISNLLVVGLGSYIIYRCNADSNFWTSLTVGQMSSLITYGIQILASINMISMIVVMFVMSIECVNRIGEVLLEEPTIKNPENPIRVISSGAVDFNHVHFKYSEKAEKDTLEDIDVHIKSGQFIGILGSTGSGKTSLVNLISRLYDIYDGSLLVDGHDVRDYDLITLRDSVAVVLQKNVLFSGTVRSNLQWGNESASDEEMLRALEISRVNDLIKDKDDLNKKVEQGGTNFSGGQKQRLCIARAILKKPKILILDDSTSAVDTKTDKLIRIALKEDLPEMTKIVIAQRISSIENADQIIIMNDGKIDQIGTHNELIKTNSIYQEVFYTQTRKEVK